MALPLWALARWQPRARYGGWRELAPQVRLVDSTRLGRIIATKSWGAWGTHTIRIVAVSNSRKTGLDAFIVLK